MRGIMNDLVLAEIKMPSQLKWHLSFACLWKVLQNESLCKSIRELGFLKKKKLGDKFFCKAETLIYLFCKQKFMYWIFLGGSRLYLVVLCIGNASEVFD